MILVPGVPFSLLLAAILTGMFRSLSQPLTKWHLVALLVLLVPVLVSAIALFIGTSNLASGLTEVCQHPSSLT
jgi:hypothetical protein